VVRGKPIRSFSFNLRSSKLKVRRQEFLLRLPIVARGSRSISCSERAPKLHLLDALAFEVLRSPYPCLRGAAVRLSNQNSVINLVYSKRHVVSGQLRLLPVETLTSACAISFARLIFRSEVSGSLSVCRSLSCCGPLVRTLLTGGIGVSPRCTQAAGVI